MAKDNKKPKASKKDWLNDRQKKFCKEYAVDLNARQAALKCGYSEKTATYYAHKWLKDPRYRTLIDSLIQVDDSKLIAKQEEILQTLTRILRRQEEETTVITSKTLREYYDEDGNKNVDHVTKPVLVKTPTKLAEVNRAAELLGKYYNMFTDSLGITHEMVGDFAIVIDAESMPEEK